VREHRFVGIPEGDTLTLAQVVIVV